MTDRPTEGEMRNALNVEQAADLLGFSPYTTREKARTGEIPATKFGREWRFSRARLLGLVGEPVQALGESEWWFGGTDADPDEGSMR